MNMSTTLAFFENLTLGKKVLLLFAPVITILVSMKAALLGLLLLLIIDLITGIRKSLHQNNVPLNLFKKSFWMTIESGQLRKSWRKSYEYGIGILVIALLRALVFGKATMITLFSQTFSLVELSVIIPAIIEIWSIFENVEAVSGNNPLKKLFSLFPNSIKLLLGEKPKKDK